MNLIVNHTQTIESPKKNDNNEANKGPNKFVDIDSPTAPENIPQELWDKRFLIPRNAPVTENIFTEFVEQGFNPNDVINMVQLIVTPATDESEDFEENSSSNDRDAKGFLTVFGHIIFVPFTRVTVDSVFTGNYSYTYAFISFASNFIMSYLSSLVMETMSFITRLYMSFVYGAALYSSLSPPEVDPYSTTRDDVYTGVTRPFALSILDICYLSTFWAADFDFESHNTLQLPINYAVMIYWLRTFFLISILLFPVIFVFFIGHPMSTLTWILEWVSQYVFGQSGTTGLLHAFLMLIRGTSLSYCIYAILEYQYSGVYLGFSCIVAIVFLQIPLTLDIKIRQNILRWITTTLIMCLFAYFGCSQAAQNVTRCSDELFIFSFSYMFIIDLILPYISAYSNYILFIMKFNSKHSKTISTLRLFTPCLMIPIILGINLIKYKVPTIIATMIIVVYINKAFAEPHIVTIAAYLQFIFLKFELQATNDSLSMFYAIIIARKIFSVVQTVHYFAACRLPYVCTKYENFVPRTNVATELIGYAINYLMTIIFGPDRSISTPALLWSVFTGSPFHTIPSIPFFLFPLPPRPNRFWNQNFIVSQFDIARSYMIHRTEHPIETPVYTSMANSLVSSLAYLVKTGKLGLVSSNNFYLFLSEPLAAFVHIIAIESNIVYFQLRGLEYNDETVCHLGEIAKLKDDIESFRDCVPNFRARAKYVATDWRLCARDIKIFQYNVSKFEADTLFLGLDKERAIFWTFLSLAYSISQIKDRYSIDNYPAQGPLNERFRAALEMFGVETEPGERTQTLKYISDQYFRLFFDDDNFLDIEKFQKAFNINQVLLFQEAARRLLLWFSLLSMGLGPENDEKEEIIAFIKETEVQYFVSPIQSNDFNDEFEKGTKDLVCFETMDDGQCYVLFFRRLLVHWDVMSIQKEFVRSFWASEALLQVFLGEDNSERMSIQEDDHTMRNLIVQACDLPIGYPAYVSPILASYNSPTNYVHLA